MGVDEKLASDKEIQDTEKLTDESGIEPLGSLGHFSTTPT